MKESDQIATRSGTSKRILFLVFALNIILLSSLLYSRFGGAFTPSGGVSIVLANDMLTPMVDMSMSYPGGNFALPRLDPNKSVGNPITISGPFEATLSFKDEQGNLIKQAFKIKPVGEFLIVIHVLPELEPAIVKTSEGKEEKFLKSSPTKVKILTTYQGENINI